jgi:hypothetical protein
MAVLTSSGIILVVTLSMPTRTRPDLVRSRAKERKAAMPKRFWKSRWLAVAAALGVAAALSIPAAFAVSPHFNYANVTSVTSNSITVNFKESGLGNSLNSVNITLSGTAECINGGSNHPKASNKSGFLVGGTFNVSNGQATGSLTYTVSVSPSCSPPMTLAFTDLVVTDTTFNDSISIPGTFTASG